MGKQTQPGGGQRCVKRLKSEVEKDGQTDSRVRWRKMGKQT